jgi:acetyl esterase/lipase
MRGCLVIVLSLALASCGGGGEATGECPADGCAIVVTSDVPYVGGDTTSSQQPLFDVYAPEEDGPWPVVVIGPPRGHGKESAQDWATAITSGGAVVFAVDFEVGAPQTPQEHLNCAARYVRDVADDYGGDPSHLTLMGSSSGAVFGMPVALGIDALPPMCLATEEAASPDAFVGYEGYYGVGGDPGDLEVTDWIDPTALVGQNPQLVVRLLHGDYKETPEQDPVSQSEEFAELLADADYDVEFSLVQGGAHSGSYLPSSPAFDVIVNNTLDVAGG